MAVADVTQTKLKRCKALYRVSTKKQSEENDIPLQRNVCREFNERMGWDLIDEKVELGISGFKISAKDRDAILELQEEALRGEFDILLVFMFDRLGRKEDETPFIVQWFVEHGIEVWSVKEGQQKFEDHVDNLINYVRFWQASGESKKTSIRVTEGRKQQAIKGRYAGGYYPYGYKIVKLGRVNKKNHEVHDLQIDEYEASVVTKIFVLARDKGYGGRRISAILTEEKIFNRNGKPFSQSTINCILDNVAYMGILKSGDFMSKIHPDLMIIDVETFAQVHEMRKKRKQKDKSLKEEAKNNNYKYVVPESIQQQAIPSDGKGLLTGLIFCGHCGQRLRTKSRRSNSRRSKNDPNNKLVTIYVCENKLYEKGKVGVCPPESQSTYVAHKIDGIIDEVVKEFLGKIKAVNQNEYIDHGYHQSINILQLQLKHAMGEKKKKQQQIVLLKKAMIDASSRGLGIDSVLEVIEEVKTAIDELDEKICECKEQFQNISKIENEMKSQYDKLITWAEVYESSDIPTRRMIIANIIEKVTVKKGYDLHIDFKITKEQFERGITFIDARDRIEQNKHELKIG